jgi:peptide subunit release factor 1 (eRF1)
MTLSERIKNLSKIRSEEFPIISLYLHFSHREAREMDRIRIFIKNITKEISKDKKFEFLKKDLKEIQNYISDKISPNTHGIAFFSSSPLKLFEAFQFWVPLMDSFTISSTPNIRQIVRTIDDYETSLLVMVDSEYARIFSINPEAVLHQIILNNDFPGRHKQGGWEQARLARHIEEHMYRHHKQVAEELITLWDRNRFSNLILAGQEHILASFEELLPKRVKENIIGHLKLQMNEKEEVILKEAVHLIRKEEEEKAKKERERFKKQGLLIENIEEIAQAANEGRIMRLYLKAGVQKDGWICKNCGVVGSEITNLCYVCGSEVKSADLIEEIVLKVERDGGVIDISLQQEKDIFAVLRF